MTDIASRDENRIPTLLGVSSIDFESPVKVYADPDTHALFTTGASGSTGVKGDTGEKGDTGTAGASGAKGDTGEKGDTGSGATGAAGPKGDTGSQGDTGTQGDTGSGATGAAGPKGDTGTAGAKGDTGTAGAVGATGTAGANGSTGVTGATGVVGATGPGTALILTEAPANQAYTGIQVSLTYGASLTPGMPVYYTSSGDVRAADANGSGTYPVIGLAMESASSGTHVVLLKGIYRDDSLFNWVVGGIIYLSTGVGTLTQSQPSATDDVIQVVGIATHADRMYVNPSPDYITHT